MDRLAHFHFIIIFSSHRWSSTSFCSAAPDPSVLPPAPSGFSTSPPPFSLRFSLSLVKLIPTAKPGRATGEPWRLGDELREGTFGRAKNCGTRNIIAPRTVLLPSCRLAQDLTSVIISGRPRRSDNVSGSRLCLCVRVALIVYYTTISELLLSSLVSVTRARSLGERIETPCPCSVLLLRNSTTRDSRTYRRRGNPRCNAIYYELEEARNFKRGAANHPVNKTRRREREGIARL